MNKNQNNNHNTTVEISRLKLRIFNIILIISLISNVVIYYLYNHSKETIWEICSTANPDILLYTTTTPFEYIYTQKPTESMGQVLTENGYSFGVNAGYFKGTYSNATPTGLLQIRDTQYSQQSADAQITTFVVLDYEDNSLEFIPNADFNPSNYSSENFTFFQTGPMIIEDSVIINDKITASLNGNGCFYRTFLGYIPEDKLFIYGISTQKVTINQVAEELMDRPEFQGKDFTIVNLDGGPSTAMFSTMSSDQNFNTQKELPLILGVK